MKITKSKRRLITEDEEQNDIDITPEDIEIDPQDDSVKEIAQAAIDSVELATDGEKSLSDTDALAMAAEIKDTAEEIDAVAAYVMPSTESFIIENKLYDALNESLETAKDPIPFSPGAGVNILVSGMPGSAKTAVVESWAKEKGIVLVSMNGSDAKVDQALNGVPGIDINGDPNRLIYRYADQKLQPLLDPKNAGNCVLFVDEFNRQTHPELRRAFLSFFNEKRNADGTVDVHKNLLFSVVCINPACNEDPGAARLSPVEVNRFLIHLSDYDSTPEAALNYFMAIATTTLSKLGVDAQTAINTLYGHKLKTKSDKNFPITQHVRRDATWEAFVTKQIKTLDLAYHMLTSTNPLFKFDTKADVTEIFRSQSNILSQRSLTDGLNACRGDKDKFLMWVDNESKLLQKDKDMLHDILDDYQVDLPALLDAYGVTSGGKTGDSDQTGNGGQVDDNEPEEDDEDLFAQYNQQVGNSIKATQQSGSKDPKQTVVDAIATWGLK